MKKESYKNIQKLLDISSNAICQVEKGKVSKQSHIADLLKTKNGFFAFKGALHIFSSKEQEEINNILKKINLYKTECLYFGEDLFGNLFCEDDNKYYLLDIERASYEYISNSLDGWAKAILDDYNYLTGYSLANEWQQANQPLKTNERLVPKIFFVLGGQYRVDNLYAMDRIKALHLRADILKQLKDVPDGSKIILEKMS